MQDSCDPLVELSDSDLIQLKNIYNGTGKLHVRYVCNFIDMLLKWRSKENSKNYAIPLGFTGTREEHGSFVVLIQCESYDIFVFTLQDSLEELDSVLTTTKRIDWTQRIVIHALHKNHYHKMLPTLQKVHFSVMAKTECHVWWISIEDSKKFDITCPSEVYIARLQKKDAKIVNDYWPYRYDKSLQLIELIIETNGGYILYMKSDNEPVAWILQNTTGAIGMLHTVDKYRGKGYGSLVTKVIAKKLAEEGLETLATVLIDNHASNKLFEKLGFKIIDVTMFVLNSKFDH